VAIFCTGAGTAWYPHDKGRRLELREVTKSEWLRTGQCFSAVLLQVVSNRS
jgi:hypothetical protein